MIATQDLLLEIGCAELPAREVSRLSAELASQLIVELTKAGISPLGKTHIYSSPRRLGLWIERVETAQKDHVIEKRGPALNAAFDAHGHPTLACLGFANSCGTTVEALTTVNTEKGAWLFFRSEQPGKKTLDLLPDMVQQVLHRLPIAKPMRWGSGDFSFVRPIRWMVLLFGEKVINVSLMGVTTGNQTYGHRVHHPQPISISHPRDYAPFLADAGKVVVEFDQRLNMIREQIQALGITGQVVLENALLNEVANLVEYPQVLMGRFDPSFLDIPKEVVMTTMQNHQRYFPVMNEQEQLLPFFVFVANVVGVDQKQKQNIIEGNERVLNARLADARFFYFSDLKQSAEQRLLMLEAVLFQKKLGSLRDKAERMAQLTRFLAIEGGEAFHVDTDMAERAGRLAKNDWVSGVVGEFPELQGIMGSYYAQQAGENEAVVGAIREHYQPRFAGDALPQTLLGCYVAIADKIDTIVGLFGAGQPPTGEKDPFALRRAALGVLRILIEKQIPLDLLTLLRESESLYTNCFQNPLIVRETFDFMMERLRAWYQERGVSAESFNAVLARLPTKPLDFHRRIQALQHFQTLSEAQALAAANKRVTQILKHQAGDWRHYPVNPVLFEHKIEKELFARLEILKAQVDAWGEQSKYTEILVALATLQAPIDQFFNEVMVMVEDESVRHNRLALLHQLQQLFLQVTDISLL